jgi:hypothetical protein
MIIDFIVDIADIYFNILSESGCPGFKDFQDGN